jgi:hypothetical protein
LVAGERAGTVVAGLGELHNVRALPSGERSPLEMTEAVNRSVATYVVHDADPLGAVGDAWTGFFNGTEPVGGLESAIEAALAVLRSGRLVLPDDYEPVRQLPLGHEPRRPEQAAAVGGATAGEHERAGGGQNAR